ncbi:MAG: PLP-dependent aminotransferase family protein [Hyphomicrobiaceae bacterium]|nr:PLP-dependent aminotransferase family protein [Hyphomicrobiaceae bacterium]
MCFERTGWADIEGDELGLLPTVVNRSGIEPHGGVAPLYNVWLDPDSPVSMWEQLYQQLRRAIVTAQLKPGTRLPATRLLASELQCSRNTVLGAFEQLIAEGYITGRCGSGTFVADNPPDYRGGPSKPILPPLTAGRQSSRGLAEAGKAILAAWHAGTETKQAFSLSQFDASLFPIQTWEKLCQAWRKPKTALLSHADPGGYWPLREALSRHLRSARAVNARPENIMITSGRLSGLEAAIRMLLSQGEAVWLEDPASPRLHAAVRSTGARIVPVGLDEEGLIPAHPQGIPEPSLIVATPAHQFPSGRIMTEDRRHALLARASSCDAWVIESDWCADFRFSGPPLPSLHTLDTEQRVIYAGSLSDLLFPALRVGFLVVPDRLAEAFGACLSALDNEPSVFVQSVLSGFIREGYFAAHVRKLRNTYRNRQAVLLEAADRHLEPLMDLRPCRSGTHLVGYLPNHDTQGLSDSEVTRLAALEHVTVQPLSPFYLGPAQASGILLGFSAINERAILPSVQRLARALS